MTSIGSPIDHPRLFIVVVSVIPLLSSYVTTVLVRWLATRQGAIIDTSKYHLCLIILCIYLIMAISGGSIFHFTNGIPSGIGFSGVVAFLFGIYVITAVLGIVLFNSFLLANLDGGFEGNNESRTPPIFSSPKSLKFFIESDLVLLTFYTICIPSFFVFGIIIASRYSL